MRTIIVSTPASDKVKSIKTNAVTFGDLKKDCDFSKIYNKDHEAILGGSKTSLTRDDAALPTGDFTLFLVASKNKLGAVTIASALNDAIDEAIADADFDSRESVEKVLGVVNDTINEFFAGGIEAQLNAAEKAALIEGKKLL